MATVIKTEHGITHTRRDAGRRYNRYAHLVSPDGKVTTIRAEPHIRNPHTMWSQHSNGTHRLEVRPGSLRLGWELLDNLYDDPRNPAQVQRKGYRVWQAAEQAIARNAPGTRTTISCKKDDGSTRERQAAKSVRELIGDDWLPVGLVERLEGKFASKAFDLAAVLADVAAADGDDVDISEIMRAAAPKKKGKGNGKEA